MPRPDDIEDGDSEEVPNPNRPTKGQRPDFWRIIHGKDGGEEVNHILDGDYDEHIAELYDMAVRHGPDLVQAIKQRMRDLDMDIPTGAEQQQVTPDRVLKPFAGFGRPGRPTPKG